MLLLTPSDESVKPIGYIHLIFNSVIFVWLRHNIGYIINVLNVSS